MQLQSRIYASLAISRGELKTLKTQQNSDHNTIAVVVG